MKILFALLLVAVGLIVYYGIKSYEKRRLKYSLFFSIPFGLLYWLGQKIPFNGSKLESFTVFDILFMFVLITLFTIIGMCILRFIDEKGYKPSAKGIKVERSKWHVFSLIILLCWLPVFLAFFPGLISNDSAVQIKQAIGEGVWSNWHPVFHTLFISVPINVGLGIFGDLTAGIALSMIVQMIILCMIFGYAVMWVQGYAGRNWIAYLLLGFFALCPIVAGYAVTMWKDVLFSAMFLLMFIKLVDLVRLKKRNDTLRFTDLWATLLIILVTSFLRNGGLLIVIGIMVALLVYYKDSRRVIAISLGGMVFVILLIQGPVYSAFNIAKSPIMESLSVPAQQIGYSVKNDVLSGEDIVELEKYADVECLKNNYESMNADLAKNCFNYGAVEQDKVGFLLLWGKLLPLHSGDFVWSYILHTYAYWNIESDAWVLDMGHNHEEIWLKREYTDKSLIGDDLKNLLIKFYDKVVSAKGLFWLSSVGVMFWGVCYVVMVFIYQRRYAMLVSMSGILVYMISLLVASPVSSIFRYVFSLLLVLPLLVVICFVREDNNHKRKESRK